ncbi:Conserved_hypothetical protein [Hexamita inflata]|uniref:Transmembrane protein n=1 Tax=Hexamita inflata TaxID=28002 RepID=A0ABP1JAE9_9EUKA
MSSQDIATFQLQQTDLTQLSIKSCNSKYECLEIPTSFYNINSTYPLSTITLSPRALRSVLYASKLLFTMNNNVQKLFDIQTFQYSDIKLQKSLHYHQLSNQIILIAPKSFTQKIQLCFDVDTTSDKSKFAFESREASQVSNHNIKWDAKFSCLNIQQLVTQSIQISYVENELYDQNFLNFDNHDILVLNSDNSLKPFENYYLIKCKDSRCHYTVDREVLDITTHVINNQLQTDQLEKGWYAVIGQNSTQIGHSIICIKNAKKYQLKFEWEYMVVLIVIVGVVWGVWILFDRIMSKSR